MSLKKYNRIYKDENDLTPRRITSNYERQHWLWEDGWEDYYDWWGYYYCDWYEADRRDEFTVPVYKGYYIGGRFRKVMVGKYWPSETWIDDTDRRNKRIDELLGDDLTWKNTIEKYLDHEGKKNRYGKWE